MRIRHLIGRIAAFGAGAALIALTLEPDGPLPVPDRADAGTAPGLRSASPTTALPGSGDPVGQMVWGTEDLALAGDRPARLAAWARRDPAGLIDSLAALDAAAAAVLADSGEHALRLAAEADPWLMLTVGQSLDGPLHRIAVSAALEALAAAQSGAAAAYLDGLAPGEDRNAYLAAVGAGIARADAEAAVDWLATLGTKDGAAFYPVIREIASVDLLRAIEVDEWAMGLDYGGPDFGASDWFFRSLGSGRTDLLRLADGLIDSPSQGLLASVIEQVAYQDPYGAIAWIQARETVPSLVVSGTAAVLAERDFRNALAMAEQLTGELRNIWLTAAFETAAFVDARAALSLLENYRDESFHAATFNEVIYRASNRLGPARAAALAGPDLSVELATRLGQAWARVDAVAALDWARSLRNEAAASAAVAAVIRLWAVNDGPAARDWIYLQNDPTLRALWREIICSVPNTECSAFL